MEKKLLREKKLVRNVVVITFTFKSSDSPHIYGICLVLKSFCLNRM